MIDYDTCKARGVIVPEGDTKGTHTTFAKHGNQWKYHTSEDPKTWIPCTDEEAKYLDKLVREAEKQYAKKVGTCPGFTPPLPPPLNVGGRRRQAC